MILHRELLLKAVELIESVPGDVCPWCGRNCWSGASHYDGCRSVAFLNYALAALKADAARDEGKP